MKGLLLHAAALTAGLANGLLGTGGGVIALPLLYSALKDEKKAHASVVLFILPLSLLSAVIYRKSVEPQLLLPLCAGAALGGAAGAFLLKKAPVSVIKIIFGLIVLYTGIRSLL